MKQRWYMHSMFNISLPAADAIYTLANVILVIGAILALVGTAGVFWSGGVRERYSDERISKNEAEAAQAKAEAAASSLRAAEVERQNIELRIKFANRRISEDQHAILVAELSRHPASFNIEVMGDSESGLYAADVLKTLTDAKWTVDSKRFPLVSFGRVL